MLKSTKEQHWQSYLERAEDPDIWTMHYLTSALASNGGKARIPALKYSKGEEDRMATTNSEKGTGLAKGFFPHKPHLQDPSEGAIYLEACCKADVVMEEQICRQLKKLKPYKAPGLDGILNVVLTKYANMLVKRLHQIYEAMLKKGLQYKPWKSFNTIVLYKPGKPRYDVLKAYHPITLLNTMWKVITAIVADQITFLSENHQLLLKHHFGGHPGCTTTDAMHLLTLRIKAAWHSGKVAAVLFLDIKGTFPNTVPERLVHNLRKWRLPTKYINFVNNMLHDRVTTLKFDGFASDAIQIDNGISQGDLLLMVLYEFYNADLLDIPNSRDKDAMAFVDDSFMLAVADSFEEASVAMTQLTTHWLTKPQLVPEMV